MVKWFLLVPETQGVTSASPAGEANPDAISNI
jgi:hypothetical protein